MATKRPLCLYTDTAKEILAADTLMGDADLGAALSYLQSYFLRHSVLTDQTIPVFRTGSPYDQLTDSILSINGSGHLAVAAKNIVMSSGNGIDFSATADAAGMTGELFDDYEKGIWTASLAFGGGSIGMTYQAQVCYYTKIGDIVVIGGLIILTAKGSSTGSATITGLPYTAGANWFSALAFSRFGNSKHRCQ